MTLEQLLAIADEIKFATEPAEITAEKVGEQFKQMIYYFIDQMTGGVGVSLDNLYAPKDSYDTLVELEAAFPTGTEGIYVVVETGNWYFWNAITEAWQSGGQYQAALDIVSELGDSESKVINQKVVSEEFAKIHDVIESQQLVNLNLTATEGQYPWSTNGQILTNENWAYLEYEIQEGDELYATGSTRPTNTALAVYYNGSTFISSESVGDTTEDNYEEKLLTIPVNATKVLITGVSHDAPAFGAGLQPVLYKAELLPVFYSKDETEIRIAEAINTETEPIVDDYLETKNILSDQLVDQEAEVVDNYYPNSGSGILYNNTNWAYAEHAIQEGDVLYATGSVRPGALALAVYYNNTTFLSSQFIGTGAEVNYVQELLTIPANATKVRITGVSFADPGFALGLSPKIYKLTKLPSFYTKEETQDLVNGYWNGKTIWWCGTSIPYGGYPQLVGEYIGATIVNKAIGSSFIRANVRTGNYVNAMKDNIIRSMSMTNEEKAYLIANWETIKSVLYGAPTAALTQDEINIINSSGFEEILLPYLDGTLAMPDLFVFDHGHNDFKLFYTKSDNQPDIDLIPTEENVGAGLEIAEDSFMTSNSNEKLADFYGDLSKISDLSGFKASVNRNTFIGAMNFIFTLILKYNPHARILIVSNNRNNKINLLSAQNSISESWMFPICKVNEKLGYSDHVIPGTNNYWADSRANDITVFDLYNKDGVHPVTDTSGDANRIYAGILSEFIKTIR